MSNVELAVDVHGLSKSFGEKKVLKDINFTLKKGTTAVIKGSNGIGKTVFLSCLLGYQSVEQGEVMILGKSIKDRVFLRKNTGFISSDRHEFMDILTPNEYFRFIIDVYQLSVPQARITELAEQLLVTHELNHLIKELSFGTKKKIQLIGCLLYQPTVLVCDEIFEGLDADTVKYVQKSFQERKDLGLTTLFTTHIMHHADFVDEIFSLENGEIIPAMSITA
ncbi:ATP-binding cassette domain-containing protein [Thermoactinomyces sp. DSM 45892]|uniref:ATP-binding cassette domain-containing protein n=1 Tax=Thermoactinomyces sp. DSM 45892 TaxID=1882753 RepID=UPI00089A424F|nr:ABC transporter ATP-binding protein [Thermoactinomyces sp. DSM 45892]SDZ13909.1 ABC-2 type transport system ATP-binding protein [Thermoactinomyces sp. DSM 45892]